MLVPLESDEELGQPSRTLPTAVKIRDSGRGRQTGPEVRK
jgi:hypothetical protein